MAGNWFNILGQGEGVGLLSGPLGSILPFLAIGMLFYLLLIRPERRKRQEMDRMLDSLNKNDQIVTMGGVWGIVVNSSKGSEFITIRVDEESNTKLRVLRTAVARVISDNKSDKPKDAST
jgi:preprotein translocase subunit YajC